MALTETSVKRPIATSMVYLIIIVLGLVGFRFLPVDLLPPIEFPQLTVYVNYPNVGPEEIETIITEPIENALAGVPNVDKVTSESNEGGSRVTMTFAQGTNLEEAANDIRAALDRVRRSLPDEVDAPGIWKFDPNDAPIVILAAKSDRPLDELTLILERELRRRLDQVPGVGSIDVWGGVYREIRVNLQRDRLLASGLTASQVEQAIEADNLTLPGGNVKEGIIDLYVRTRGEYTSVEEISNTIITTVNGLPVRVRDVASVEDTYKDMDRFVVIDGDPMIRAFVRKQTGANTVEVSELVQKEIEKINAERSDLQLLVVSDQSSFIRNSISGVQQSAIWGAFLAILILYIFLRNGSTTWIIALAIPISIIATFALLYFNGLTLNQMSFGGLALGVGLIVDNAIVVLENIVRLRKGGLSLKESALTGTRQVTGAIIASTLTTCVIFLPVVFMSTITGTMFQQLALVVVFALICSLLVALTLVPMLSSRFLTTASEEQETEPAHNKTGWFNALEERYNRVLEKAVERRFAIFAVALVLVGVSFYGFSTISVELAPQTEADEISIDLNLADGVNIAIAQQFLFDLEQKVREIAPMDQVKHFSTEIRWGRAEVELTMREDRTISTYALADELRKKLDGQIPGANIRVSAQSGLWILRRIFGSGGDESLEIQLRGYDQEVAQKLSDEIVNRVRAIPYVSGVRSDQQEGRPEQNILFDREKIADLGLSTRAVAQAIQANVGGARAGVYREDGEEFDITVRLREQDRLSTLDLDNIAVRTPSGQTIPVSSVVDQKASRGPTNIRRINGQRVTYITATLESGVPIGEAVEQVQQELSGMTLPAGFSIVYGGEYEEQQKAQGDFRLTIIMALILIYMVMAAQFERFVDPLIVMFSIPVAIIGVVPIMLLTGTTLNMQSIMGLVMLIGIVVNNAIVLVDYINLIRREEGHPVREAVIKAGSLRLRPILMTTLTTVLGLLPLSFALGAGGEIQAALARVVIGGLAASTLITLFLIPIVYIQIDLFGQWIRSRSFSLPWSKGGESLQTAP